MTVHFEQQSGQAISIAISSRLISDIVYLDPPKALVLVSLKRIQV